MVSSQDKLMWELFLFLVGVYMGALGSGGSILTIPLLLYIIRVGEDSVIPLSLGIVGLSSAVGSILKFLENNLDWKRGLVFSLFSFPGGYFGSYLGGYLGPVIQLNAFLVLLFFVFLYISYSLNQSTEKKSNRNALHIGLVGITVGFLTGILGVGGGFFLIPIFHEWMGLDFHKAAGTSLFVIFLNSISSLVGYSLQYTLPYSDILYFGSTTSAGILLGSSIGRLVNPKILKKFFLLSILLTFIGIIWKKI
jgi:uncharacterized membrane protein YfcA